MTSRYISELLALEQTYREAMSFDCSRLGSEVSRSSESGIIAVGSGGSYTLAVLLASLHERATGRLSRAMTPLELVSNQSLADEHPVFFVSAEGKNPDIVEAYRVASKASSPRINIITNVSTSRLTNLAARLGNSVVHTLDVLSRKDGYLAVNSLIATATVLLRAYHQRAPRVIPSLPRNIGDFFAVQDSFSAVVLEKVESYKSAVQRDTICILFDPEYQAVATDLESKLTESALRHAQLADLRAFAHGRHLWLAKHGATTAVCGIIGRQTKSLWQQLASNFPETVRVVTIENEEHSWSSSVIRSLIEVFTLVAAAGQLVGVDPGRPAVPDFGKRIYYSNIRKALPRPRTPLQDALSVKRRGLGHPPVGFHDVSPLRTHRNDFIERLRSQPFRAVVLDYDGTLCPTDRRFDPPPTDVVAELLRLARAGIRIGVASGRGDSLHNAMQTAVPPELHVQFTLGMYNGGHIAALSEPYSAPRVEPSPELHEASKALEALKTDGVPIDSIRFRPFQITVTPSLGVNIRALWLVVAERFLSTGLPVASIKTSGHSLDIVATDVSKRAVVDAVRTSTEEPVLTIGDQGQWPGNDHELLSEPFALSVDQPTRSLASGWNIAPPGKRGCAATVWLLRRLTIESGYAIFTASPTSTTENS